MYNIDNDLELKEKFISKFWENKRKWIKEVKISGASQLLRFVVRPTKDAYGRHLILQQNYMIKATFSMYLFLDGEIERDYDVAYEWMDVPIVWKGSENNEL